MRPNPHKVHLKGSMIHELASLMSANVCNVPDIGGANVREVRGK